MRFRILSLAALPLTLALSACIFGGGDDDRSGPVRPRASGPVTLDLPTSRETQQCYTDLSRAGVSYSPLPDRDFGGGCLVIGSVQLLDIGVPVSGLKSMRCPLAREFLGWVRFGVAPAARRILGSDVVRIESFGTYACRSIVGNAASSGKISQHGLANAVDVAAFILADGRRISVERGWKSPDRSEREFLETVHQSACKRFVTVLGPEYNAAHYNHFHFDMGGSSFCR